MKKIVLTFLAVSMCLLSVMAIRQISATTSSPIAASPPGKIGSHSLGQTSGSMMRAPNQGRTLSFAERVSYQRAIENVYWRHRIWPKERPDRKPSLDAVMSQAQLEKKVEDYLRDSQMLEDHWQRPITTE